MNTVSRIPYALPSPQGNMPQAANEIGPFTERAAVRNRAILWLLYDTGICVSELINSRLDDLDRKHGVVTVLGKGAKERRIALAITSRPACLARECPGGRASEE